MNRRDVLLALLSAANGRAYTPAQLQKGVFLLTKASVIDDGPSFNFVPYDYGPFDRAVYLEAELLQKEGLAEIKPSGFGPWHLYAATPPGVERGISVLAKMKEAHRNYVVEISRWVRAQSFTGLVKSIYQAYPEMRANSIFRD
jgi:hypothetical protein